VRDRSADRQCLARAVISHDLDFSIAGCYFCFTGVILAIVPCELPRCSMPLDIYPKIDFQVAIRLDDVVLPVPKG